MSKTAVAAPTDDRFEELFQFIDKMTMRELKRFLRKFNQFYGRAPSGKDFT